MLDKILEYQKLDSQIKSIETELSSTEERKRTRSLLQFLKETEEKLKKMETDVADLASKYNALTEQYYTHSSLLAEYAETVNTVIDEEELNYLRKKHEDLVRVINNIESELATLSKESIAIAKQFDDCKAKLPIAKKQYAEAKEKFDAIRKDKEPEISRIQRKKADLEKAIPEEVLKLYKELKEQNISRPFVALEAPNRCGGCRMELPIGKMSSLESKGYIRCESCHRIVYK